MRKRAVSSRWQGMFDALGFGRREIPKSLQSLKQRGLHFEPLEERQLLTVLYWDPQHTNTATAGGQGTWTNGSADWYNGQTDIAWNNSNGDVAMFQGTADTVTVNSSGVSAGSIGFAAGSYTLSGGTITLTQSNTSGWTGGQIDVGSGITDEITSILAGSVGLTKTGSGVLTLTGASTYSGNTAVRNGTLAVAGGDDRLPTGTAVNLGTSTTNGILQLGDGTTACNQTVAGIGTPTGQNMNGASRVVGGGSSLATLTVDVAGVHDGFIFYGAFGGPGQYQNNLTLTKIGLGTEEVVFGGGPYSTTSTYTGGTNVDQGTLDLSNYFNNLLGDSTSPINLGGGSLIGNYTLNNPIVALTSTTSNMILPISTFTINGNISGAGNINCTNAYGGVTSVLNLGGDNSGFTGTFEQANTTYASFTTYLTTSDSGSAAANWIINSGTLAAKVSGTATIQLGGLSGSGTLSNALAGSTVTYQIGSDQSTEFDGTVTNGSGTVALTKVGSGTLTLTGSNTYTGGTTISGGTLSLGSANAIGTSGTITFSGGTLQFTSSNTTDYSSRFSTAANQAYNINTNGQSVTLASALTSSGGTLQKVGSGTLTLMGSNTYTGGTTISEGTLQLGSGTVNGSIKGNITDNATLVFARSSGKGYTYSGVISGSGMVTKTGSGTVSLTGANTYSGGTTITAGTLSLSGASDCTGGTQLDGGELDVWNDNALGPAVASNVLTLAGGCLVSSSNLSNDILVQGSTSNTIITPDDTLTLNGDISGSGTITATPQFYLGSYVVNLGGDNSGFTGTFIQAITSWQGSITTYFTSASAGSANATWEIDTGTLAADISGAATIRLGASQAVMAP